MMSTGGIIAVAFLAIVILLVIRGMRASPSSPGKLDERGTGTHVDSMTDHEGWDGGASD